VRACVLLTTIFTDSSCDATVSASLTRCAGCSSTPPTRGHRKNSSRRS
jgi:hypothetical protein